MSDLEASIWLPGKLGLVSSICHRNKLSERERVSRKNRELVSLRLKFSAEGIRPFGNINIYEWKHCGQEAITDGISFL